VPENTTVLELISHEYYRLTAAEKKTADFVLSHLEETQFMSITELSEASGVAEATVSRFCRRLGYRGYNAFKLAIANTTSQQSQWANPLSGRVETGDSMDIMCQKLCAANVSAITQTMELIDPSAVRQAVDMLEAAGKVLCMGQGGSMILASEAAHLFSTVSGKFMAVSDSHTQAVAASMLDENDVILFFSYSGSTLDMMQTLKLARRRGAKVILLTRFLNSPGAELAHISFPYGATENPLQLGSVAVRIAQLYLLDVIFSELCQRNLEECRRRRKEIADALAEKHL
jgi:DNA-binding MurR/RpiR family transcriptional regulator